jgi:26S proteasome regulatory subunit N7
MEAKLLGAGGDEGDATVQDLKVALAQRKFDLLRSDLPPAERKAVKDEVQKSIFENDMSFVYEHFCTQLGWEVDQEAIAKMQANNEAKRKELEEKIEECEKNQGDEEVRDAMLDRADYLCNIGDKERAWKAYEEVEKKSPGANHKLTIAFCKIRLELLFGNWTDIKQLLEHAKDMCEKGGDWEKKNRLMVCPSVHARCPMRCLAAYPLL